MNNSHIDLNCRYHLGQKVIFIDESQPILGLSRAMCAVCLRNNSRKNNNKSLEFLAIDEFQTKAIDYASKQESKTKEKFDLENEKLKSIQKCFINLKLETLIELDNLIHIVQDTLEKLNKILFDDQANLKDFGCNTSYTRLLEIAEILIDKTKQDSALTQINQKLEEFTLQITNSVQIFKEKITKNLDQISNNKSHTNINSQQNDIQKNNIQFFNTLPKKLQEEKTQLKVGYPRKSLQNSPQKFNEDRQPKIERFESLILQGTNQAKQFNGQITLQKGSLDSIQPINYSQQELKHPAVQEKKEFNFKSKEMEQQSELVQHDQIEQEELECQILVSNPQQWLIVGGSKCNIIIWEHGQQKIVQRQICQGHSDQVTGIVLYNSQDIIVSGAMDKALIVWKKNKSNEWQIQTWEHLNHDIIQLELSPDEKQILVQQKDYSIISYSMNSQQKLNLIQVLSHTHQISSFSVNQIYLAVGCVEKFLNIYDFNELKWNLSFKIAIESQVHQLCFTEDNELVCQYSNPPSLIVYYILDDTYTVAQIIRINNIQSFETFPIFKIYTILCCKFGQTIYFIKKSEKGDYEIFREILGNYQSACSDITGTSIILKDRFKNELEVYNLY